MALPSAYLTSTKNLQGILAAVQGAQAPPRFTQKFLESLGFASTTDRLVINVFKSVGLLTETGIPTQRYHEFLDRSQAKRVLADGIRDAYADLFQVNVNANGMSRVDVKNKMKTLSQGQYSDSVLDKMASTFKALSDQADFSGSRPLEHAAPSVADDGEPTQESGGEDEAPRIRVGGLVYNLNIHLPESRDPAVYDALFRSLREHLK